MGRGGYVVTDTLGRAMGGRGGQWESLVREEMRVEGWMESLVMSEEQKSVHRYEGRRCMILWMRW